MQELLESRRLVIVESFLQRSEQSSEGFGSEALGSAATAGGLMSNRRVSDAQSLGV